MDKDKKIKKLEQEIALYYRYRSILLIIALVALGVAINIFIILLVYPYISELFHSLLVYLASTNAVAFPTLLIIRSAAFNKRITNRKRLIEKLEQESPEQE